MFSCILIVIAAICNALMDTCTHHYSTSIFKNLDEKFYNPYISWEFCKTFWGYHLDFWHICKSIMLFSLVGAIVLYKPIFVGLIDFYMLGLLWNMIFNIFYNRILRTKKP